MKWLDSEETAILSEIRFGNCLKTNERENHIMKKLLLSIAVVGLLAYANFSYADEIIECPYCDHEILIESPIAREVKYAGCYCDNCGRFYSTGDKCPGCGYPRKKLKWDESDGW